MATDAANLGVCFYNDRLYYAINDPAADNRLERIGALSFNFDLHGAIPDPDSGHHDNLKSAFNELIGKYSINSARILTDALAECWSILPKLVYDNADEREDHIGVLMQGVERENIEVTWHSLSNADYRLLCLRRRNIVEAYQSLSNEIPTTECVSDFELGDKWEGLQKKGGSYLLIGCLNHGISITSYLLGKLRASTYITYDDVYDLPYHWLQRSAHLSWLKGIHEDVYVYGHQAYFVVEALQGFWDKSSRLQEIKNLDIIGVEADEETYGFELGCAFPAIVMALDK